MYKNVIFDLDGTLTDSYQAITSSVKYAIDAAGLPPIKDEKILRPFIGPALVFSFEKHCGVDRETADKLVELYRQIYRKGNMFLVSVYEGIIPLLEYLKNNGYHMFVATSKPIDFAVPVLEKTGLAEYFKKIQAPSFADCENSKDYLINSIIKEFSLKKEECIMIGDTRFDIEGGIKSGIKTIGVTYGYPSHGDFEKADFVAEKPLDIKEILKGINL